MSTKHSTKPCLGARKSWACMVPNL
ncbi:unnamed protein product [Acanthoscelides obtectus]|uniref:Uncharacterized protein n=1 Tax=Acanthoscelides obtectus TaxID=200917 RepID=A0A9P0JM01_ACAOB|nr:unnamed protein product [Acanthoscelides obtectus]CAK1654400.1 hypothetical protein AOBTE_LOCUS18561 [Acanthoscelides obtectus]